MKIALCISGQFRNSMFCFPSIYRSFISNYNTDVFMHSWEYSEELFDLYKPTKIILDNQEEVYESLASNIKIVKGTRVNPYSNVKNNLLMYYGIYNSVKMVSDDYDFVIRLRPDLYFRDKFDLESTIQNLSDKKYDLEIPDKTKNHSGLNDQIAIGSLDKMRLYSNVFLNIPSVVNTTKYWHPESILMNYIKSLNLNVNQMDYEYGLVRDVKVDFSKHTKINYKNI